LPDSTLANTCIDAYLAYGHDEWIQKARTLWEHLQHGQISETDIAFGSHNNSAFQLRCGGSTRAVHNFTIIDAYTYNHLDSVLGGLLSEGVSSDDFLKHILSLMTGLVYGHHLGR
jgi:hypothetical protein